MTISIKISFCHVIRVLPTERGIRKLIKVSDSSGMLVENCHLMASIKKTRVFIFPNN